MRFWFALIFVLIPTEILTAAEKEPAELLSDGKMLTENNCAVCDGGTREGFLEGISLIEQAIEGGYEDRLSAYKELASAYVHFINGYTRSNSERKIYIRKFRELYESILKLHPNETELRMSYADTSRDTETRLAEYRKILEIDPGHFDARSSWGANLIATREPKKMEQGVEELKIAIGLKNNLQPGDFYYIFQGQVEDLKTYGRSDLSQELSDALAEEIKRRDAEREN